jgi:hypothetical protein
MKLSVTLVVGSVIAAFVLLAVLMMHPALGEAYFAAFWWGMTVIVMVICLAFIYSVMADAAEEPNAPGTVR